MITFQEIKDILKDRSLEEIDQSYDERQESAKLANDTVIKEIMDKHYDSVYRVINSPNLANAFFTLLVLVRKSKSEKGIETLNKILNDAKYNQKAELIWIMQIIEHFMLGEHDFKTTEKYLNAFSSFRSFQTNDSNILINTTFGDTNITSAFKCLGFDDVAPEKRHGECHNLTYEALLYFPNLYGAYYYIPLFFRGYFDHSVLIDRDKFMVYDLANNIALPLSFFKKYYPNYSYVINGKELSELDKQMQAEYGTIMSMPRLETFRRIRKKQELK